MPGTATAAAARISAGPAKSPAESIVAQRSTIGEISSSTAGSRTDAPVPPRASPKHTMATTIRTDQQTPANPTRASLCVGSMNQAESVSAL